MDSQKFYVGAWLWLMNQPVTIVGGTNLPNPSDLRFIRGHHDIESMSLGEQFKTHGPNGEKS
jgi:hypothetical protein